MSAWSANWLRRRNPDDPPNLINHENIFFFRVFRGKNQLSGTKQEIVRGDPLWKEVRMLQSVEEVGYERGREEGREESREETVKDLLKSGWLTYEQIAQIMKTDVGMVSKLAQAQESG